MNIMKIIASVIIVALGMEAGRAVVALLNNADDFSFWVGVVTFFILVWAIPSALIVLWRHSHEPSDAPRLSRRINRADRLHED